MREHPSINKEFRQAPEHVTAPEYNVLPEYTPVYPDINFFKEHAVTAREENIFQGEVPPGEPARDLREERKEKRSKYNLLQKLLGLASRGGVIALALLTVISALVFNLEEPLSEPARKAAAIVSQGKKPAFHQTQGYSPEEFARLWEKDPDAPHAYDFNNPIIYYPSGCVDEGEIELVCMECGVHRHDIIPANGHTAGTPVKENEAGTVDCTHGASYENVVYCDVCGAELSRTRVDIPANGHTAGDPVRENVTATCTEPGSYSEVVYCTVCGAEIRRTNTESAALGHDLATRRENTTAATCIAAGSYQEVQYCTRCGEVVARNTYTLPMIGHTAGRTVDEVIIEATCAEEGEGERVTYCSICGEEMSRERYTIATTGHTAGQPTEVIMREATCAEEGEAVLVTYCTVCGDELERGEPYIIARTEHQYQVSYEWTGPDETSYQWDENVREFYCTATGVCSLCGDEITERSQGEGAEIQEKTCTQDGEYTFTAYFVNDEFETATHRVTVAATGHVEGTLQTENVKEPTCEEPGTYDVVAYCAVCGEEMNRQTNEAEAALGHDWDVNGVSYVWADDHSSVTATVHCRRDDSHVLTETAQADQSVVQPADCEVPGLSEYSATFTHSELGSAVERAEIPALGHDWQTSYSYTADANDRRICEATAVCRNNPDHTETQTVAAEASIDKEATCEEDGSVTYTFTFTGDIFSNHTDTETIAALGHDWGDVTYTWADDNSSCTASATCSRDASHTKSYEANVTDTTLVEADCENGGSIRYTATFDNNDIGAEEQYRDVRVEALGHDYGEPSYEWFELDGVWFCRATRVCSRDADHIDEEMVESEETVITDVSCESNGEYRYTATFTNSAFTTQTTTRTVQATGHLWDDPTYEEGTDPDMNRTMTARISCLYDDTHGYTEVSTAVVETTATCDQPGETTYTFNFDNDLFETQVVTEPAEALGHDYGPVTYEWTEDGEGWICTATATCSRCGETNTESQWASATSRVPATCEEDGSATYAVSFDDDAFETQEKTVTIAATGHNWGDPEYFWDETDTGFVCIAVAVCQNDDAHEARETATAVETSNTATCDQGGIINYSAEFQSDVFTTQTYRTQTGPLGHDYEVSYEWTESDNGTYCIATGVCRRCGDTIQDSGYGEEEILTEATYTTHGEIEYTAQFSNDVFETQTKTGVAHYPENREVIENVDGECGELGSYDLVSRCPVCGEVLWSDHIDEATIPHDFGLQDEWGRTVIPADGSDPTCSRCGASAFTLEVNESANGNALVLTIDPDFAEAISRAGLPIEEILFLRIDDDPDEPAYSYAYGEYDDATNQVRVLFTGFQNNNSDVVIPESGSVYSARIKHAYYPFDDPEYDWDNPTTVTFESNTVTIP